MCFGGLLALFGCFTFTGGLCFGLVGSLMLKWDLTRQKGLIIVRRVTRAPQNWELYPGRSFMEIALWLMVIYGTSTIMGSSNIPVMLIRVSARVY